MLIPAADELVSETAGGGAEVGCMVSDVVRAVVGCDETACVVSGDECVIAGAAGAGSVVCDEARTLAAGAEGGSVSLLLSVSSAPCDELFRALADVLWLPLRNRRHVSELCSASAALLVTAVFAPKALLVSASSWPVIGSPLRI